jgi:hypothetical protein
MGSRQSDRKLFSFENIQQVLFNGSVANGGVVIKTENDVNGLLIRLSEMERRRHQKDCCAEVYQGFHVAYGSG